MTHTAPRRETNAKGFEESARGGIHRGDGCVCIVRQNGGMTMGWKNVKEYYRIGHIVQVVEGKGICIGSPYVYDRIVIAPGKSPKWCALGPSENDDLARYFAEMTADPAKLAELIDAPDTFERSIPVWTFGGGKVIEKQCETLGWPNCTHDGELMYDNTHFASKADAIAKAKREADCWVKLAIQSYEEADLRLAQCRRDMRTAQDERAQLEHDYPSEPDASKETP